VQGPIDRPVSVVVCTLGRQPGLRRTVDAILGQTHADLEVLVVDNDPASGGVAGLLAGVADPRLRVVPEPARGLSRARNTGLRAARGELVAYTDDDALPASTWIEALVSVIHDDPTGAVACVTGRVVAAETATAAQRWFEDLGDFDKGTDRTVWSLRPPPAALPGRPGPHSVFFPYTAGEMGSGNNMLFRTAVLRALGGFDEALGTGSPARGGEDLDVYRRIVLAGWVLVYTPDAVVRHRHRDTPRALRTQMFGYGAGMAASLTKVLVGGGPPARALLRRLPRGVYMLVWPSSAKNQKFPARTPPSLVAAETLGYLAGPLLYARSVVRARRRRAPAAPSRRPGDAPTTRAETGFRPRRVVAVDLATGSVDHPDPAVRPAHPDARVLVCWLGEPVGLVEVTAPDTEIARATGEAAWRSLRAELTAAAARHGLPPPGALADLVGAEPAPVDPPPGSRPLVTVTVAGFRNVAPTVDCVRRILLSSWTPLEVVVVDNDVDPAPLTAALQAAFGDDERVRWVHEPRQGLSFARNAGLAAAKGEITVFTDDDVRVDRRWVERLVAAFDAADDVACVTGAILPSELETQSQLWLEEFGGFHKGFRRRIFNATSHRRDMPLYPYNAGLFGSGANMAFRTEAIRSLGGFAVDLGAGTAAWGGEDLDVFQRTIAAGHTLVYEPTALMWHNHRRSYAALRRQMFHYGVGLSATVTKWMLDDRRTAAAIVRRLPPGAQYLLSPRSKKNHGKSATFPPSLTRLELLGVIVGPVAYLRSRRRARRLGAGDRQRLAAARAA
jgi:cellulose synthase/poly-beta-1,6-N-acetylglucosamine synthase-like glycosyltransferase